MKQYSEYKDSGVKWIGEIPSHWKTVRIKNVTRFNPPKTKENKSIVGYAPMECVRNGNIEAREIDTNKLSSGLTYFEEGDLVVAKVTPCFENGNIAIATNLRNGCAYGSSELFVFRCNKIDDKYLFYYMQEEKFKHKCCSTMTGTGGLKRVSSEFIRNAYIPFPTILEQQAIVSYLDTRVSKIDSYIVIAEKEITALDELKQATITDAVTQGINPKTPMKDSGIPWIGMVPEHWTRARYKDILNIEDEKVGKRNDLTLLSLTKKGVIVRDLSEGKGKFPKDYESYKVVNPNNIILCLFDVDETPRTVGVSHNKGMITGAYDIFEIKNAKLEYIYYLYLSIDDKKGFKSLYKGLRKVIPLPSLLSAYINLPPISEQNEIVAYINRKVAQIEKIRVSELAQIEKLKEYKQRLISDVVTGKVKVTND